MFDSPLADIISIEDPPHVLLAEFYGEAGWNVERLKHWLPMDLVHKIYEIQLYPDQDDCMVWLESTTRTFMFKSAWEALRQRRNRSTVDRLIYNDIVPLKISLCT